MRSWSDIGRWSRRNCQRASHAERRVRCACLPDTGWRSRLIRMTGRVLYERANGDIWRLVRDARSGDGRRASNPSYLGLEPSGRYERFGLSILSKRVHRSSFSMQAAVPFSGSTKLRCHGGMQMAFCQASALRPCSRLPDLWLTGWLTPGRDRPPRVWGPRGTKRMMSLIEQAFEYAIGFAYTTTERRQTAWSSSPRMSSGCRRALWGNGRAPIPLEFVPLADDMILRRWRVHNQLLFGPAR